jgi:hypothetical protein
LWRYVPGESGRFDLGFETGGKANSEAQPLLASRFLEVFGRGSQRSKKI